MTELSDHYMCVRDYARRFCLDESTVYRMIDRGEIKAIRIGKKTLRLPSSELGRYQDRDAQPDTPARSERIGRKRYSSAPALAASLPSIPRRPYGLSSTEALPGVSWSGYRRRERRAPAGTWNPERVIAALRDWAREFGEPPRIYEWSVAVARAVESEDGRVRRWAAEHPRWPGPTPVIRCSAHRRTFPRSF